MASGPAAQTDVHIVDNVEELLDDGDASEGLHVRLFGDIGHVQVSRAWSRIDGFGVTGVGMKVGHFLEVGWRLGGKSCVKDTHLFLLFIFTNIIKTNHLPLALTQKRNLELSGLFSS